MAYSVSSAVGNIFNLVSANLNASNSSQNASKNSAGNLLQRITNQRLSDAAATLTAAQTAGSTAAGNSTASTADSQTVSKTAQDASTVYNSVQKTGTENAAAFRNVLSNLVSSYSQKKNTISNYLSLGLALTSASSNVANTKSYTNLTLMANTINSLSANSNTSSNLINTAYSTMQKFGTEGLSNFVSANKSVMNQINSSADKTDGLTAVNNLNRLWENTSNVSGASTAEINKKFEQITKDLGSKTNLNDMNQYLEEKIKELSNSDNKTNDKEETKSTNTITTNSYNNTRTINGFEFSTISASLQSAGSLMASYNAIQGNNSSTSFYA